MMFRRSGSSLASLHLFYQVDVVVFCEGGPSLTREMAMNPSIGGLTNDEIFWKNIVTQFAPSYKKYHFKSVGSKTTLVSLADDVIELKVKTVSICIDADYDRLLNKLKQCDRLISTYGYSWENDAVLPHVAHVVISRLIGPLSPEQKARFEHDVFLLSREILYWTEIDIALRAKGKPSVFNRDKPMASIDLQKNPPCLKISQLRQTLTLCGYVRRPQRVIKIALTDAYRCAFGKLVSNIIYRLSMNFIISIIPNFKLKYDLFMKLFISESVTWIKMNAGSEVHQHYRSAVIALA